MSIIEEAMRNMNTEDVGVLRMIVDDLVADIQRKDAALQACVECWRNPEIPCPPALYDQVTTALGTREQPPLSLPSILR